MNPGLPDKLFCYGCQACKAACPAGAIEMRPDAEGFLYPAANVTSAASATSAKRSAACTGCAECLRVCPALGAPFPELKPPRTWLACLNLESQWRRQSSSGGLFPALAAWMLKQGGSVYAAALDLREPARVRHIGLSGPGAVARLPELLGSKYVQSHLENVPEQICDQLKKQPVLFCGTPCQVAGLKLISGDPDNLFTLDLVCYGVPSPLLFSKYIAYLGKLSPDPAAGSAGPPMAESPRLERFCFRDKATGWKHPTVSWQRGGHSHCEQLGENPYNWIFFQNLALRPACHSCRFATAERCGDLTLGDCHGVAAYYPEMDDDCGTSLALINTGKGQTLWQAVQGGFKYAALRPDQAMQPRLREAAAASPLRADFMADLAEFDFAGLLDKYVLPMQRQFLLKKVRQNRPGHSKLVKQR